ncbi:MAG: hypothetical protein AAFU73_12645 [Planctomycetota bacterium]
MGARGTDDPRGRGALLAILGIGAAALLAAFAIRSIGPEGAPVPPESPARGDVAHGLEAPRVDGPADGPDAIPRMGAASSAPALPPELTVAAAGLVDLFLVRPDGGPFLGASQGGSGSRTRGRLRDGLSVLVVENGEVSSSYEITAQAGRRLLSDPRWFCSFARPVGAATVEARYGTAVVDAAELAPGQAAVTLTLSEAALDGLACSVVGVAPGTPDEGIELALHPLDVPLPGVGSFDRALVLEPRWSGARFRIDGVPPGRAVLRFGSDLAFVERAALRGAGPAAGTPGGLARSALTPEQFDLRARLFAESEARAGSLALELSPGELRDVGALEGEPTGAAVLRLNRSGTDERRAPLFLLTLRPLPSGSEELPSGSEELPSGPEESARVRDALGSEPAKVVWSDGARVLLAPVPLGRYEALVASSLGDAALIELDVPHGPSIAPAVDLDLRHLAQCTVALPDGAALRTSRGAPLPLQQLRTFPGFDGWEAVHTLPAGRFTLEFDGRRRILDLTAGEEVDARVDPPVPLEFGRATGADR